MKFEKINDNVLKVFLSSSEFSDLGSLSDVLNSGTCSRDSFVAILDRADSAVGFDIKNRKVKIRAQMLDNGNYALTFIKLVRIQKGMKKARPKKVLKVKANPDFAVYKFDTLSDFEDFCSCLKRKNCVYLNRLCRNSMLYHYENSYFLVCDGFNEKHKDIALFYSSITEFANYFTSNAAFKATLREYGSLVLENHALVLSQKFF